MDEGIGELTPSTPYGDVAYRWHEGNWDLADGRDSKRVSVPYDVFLLNVGAVAFFLVPSLTRKPSLRTQFGATDGPTIGVWSLCSMSMMETLIAAPVEFFYAARIWKRAQVSPILS